MAERNLVVVLVAEHASVCGAEMTGVDARVVRPNCRYSSEMEIDDGIR